MNAPTTIKGKRSEQLTAEELDALKNYRSGFQTEVECALSIGVDRLVLNRTQMVGSCSPASAKKIRKVLRRIIGAYPEKA
jgi:hypothetical protein